MIKQGIINEELSVDSHLRRENGLCPLMPEEVGLLLRSMGYPSKTIIYLAGSETFGGQRVLIPLRAMFPNLVDLTSLCSKTELSDLVGPETPLPADTFRLAHQKSEQQLKDEWNKAGPRPRPLPPPPDRPIYQHEKEGWYGWITENDKEPEPSLMDLRMQAHRLLWDALDYIVSVEADAFIPGYNNDGSAWPDFSGLVMGQRLYERASSRTYRPDRKTVAALFNITRDDMYHPKNNWTLSVKEHLNRSLSEDGLIRQSLFSKPTSFLSHPLPECSCRISSVESTKQTKGKDGRYLYGGEQECPKWMQSAGVEGVKNDDNEVAEDDNDVVEQPESDGADMTSSLTSLIDHDEEWDPND
ncbi:GDP-fucose protein O-fucosyltransferase [Corchorus olitorius]|uniref:O-fucosyltransferase family protein n=1 Tax=Corchorus olitorius TaxID=93759 RepID=A0A1R3GWV6_9ROSI|nr:GDP-fucose protein O-fucosyltransferase [Corchorus olitorius]